MGLGSPLVAEYLNKKYGTKFPISPGGCNALTTKAFVQPDGAMFPCQELTEYFTTRGGKKITIPRQSVLDSGAKEIWESKLYNGLLSALFKPDALKNYVPCNQCKYLGSICWPCPLPSLRGDRLVMSSCYDAMKRMQDDGIVESSDVPISYQDMVDRAANDPHFRVHLTVKPDDAINQNNYSVDNQHSRKIIELTTQMQGNMRKQIESFFKKEQTTKEAE